MGGKLINTDADENNSMAGSLAFASSELTIATGSVTATRSHHTIDTEADAGSDDLDTIATGSVSDEAVLRIRAANTARTVVVKHSTGNILMADDSDFSLDDDEKSITLQRRGANWHEIGRAPGGLSGATATQMEAASATDAAVTPAVAQRHPSAVKAWGTITTTAGTVTDVAGYNLDATTDNGAGDYTFNFTTIFSSANYGFTLGYENIAGGINHQAVTNGGRATGSLRVQIQNNAGTNIDGNAVSIAAYGDQ